MSTMSGGRHTFRVRIHYREPTYEMYAGSKRKPYHWTYQIVAPDAAAAKALALEEFHAMARNSGVSWTREVVLIELEGASAA